jgi:hypothetical protein
MKTQAIGSRGHGHHFPMVSTSGHDVVVAPSTKFAEMTAEVGLIAVAGTGR